LAVHGGGLLAELPELVAVWELEIDRSGDREGLLSYLPRKK
jgi:hypothetical protein